MWQCTPRNVKCMCRNCEKASGVSVEASWRAIRNTLITNWEVSCSSLCLQPLNVFCKHMVLKVKVSHQADDSDVAGTSIISVTRYATSCIHLFVFLFVCFNVTWVHILSLGGSPHCTYMHLFPLCRHPANLVINMPGYISRKKSVISTWLVTRSRNSVIVLSFGISWRCWRL